MTIASPSRGSHSLFRRIALAGAATVIAILGSIGVAGTASAAAGDCPSGSACIWGDQDYKTGGNGVAFVPFRECHHNYALSTFAGTSTNADDKATSVSNNGNVSSASFYPDPLYRGTPFTLAKKTGDGHLNDSTGNAPGGFDDRLSSGKFSSFGTNCR